MSRLKHMSLRELYQEQAYALQYIKRLKSELAGQEEKLKWISHYVLEKSKPVEMTVAEIEDKLGHPVLIKKESE